MADERAIPELGPAERAVAMRKFPGASALTREQLAVLASVARPRTLAPGELAEGLERPVLAICVLVSGSWTLADGSPGPEASGTLHVLAGDTSPVPLRGGPAGATVLEVAMEDLEDVVEEVPAVSFELARHVGRRAHALRERSERPAAAALPLVLPPRPLDLVERLIVLRRCDALAGVHIDALADLASIATELKIAPGERAWSAGDAPAALVVLAAGELTVEERGVPVRLGPGDMAGEVEVLAGQGWTSSAVARAPTLLVVLAADPLLDLWEDHPGVGLALLRNVAASVLGAQRERTRGSAQKRPDSDSPA